MHLAGRNPQTYSAPTYPVCTSLTYHRDHLTSTSHTSPHLTPHTSPHTSLDYAQTSLHSFRAFRFWPLLFRVFLLTSLPIAWIYLDIRLPSTADIVLQTTHSLPTLRTNRCHPLTARQQQSYSTPTSQKPCDNDHCPLLLCLALSVNPLLEIRQNSIVH